MNKPQTHILFVTGSAPPMTCGVGDYTFYLAKHLGQRAGINVTILTSSEATPVENTTFSVVPFFSSWSLFQIFKFAAKLRKIKPDIIHAQYPTQGYKNGLLPYFMPLICFAFGIRFVQTWHEFYGLKSLRFFWPNALSSSGLVFVRPEYKRFCRVYNYFKFNKTTRFIQNGATIPISSLGPDAVATRKRELGGDKFIITFFGFIYPHKGVDLIFEAADPDSDIIVIAGKMSANDEYRRKLMALADSPRWSGKVKFLGYIEAGDVADLLRVSEVALLPFTLGGGEWNTSIHAAVKNACPVVTTSRERRGLDKEQNIFYSEINSVVELKKGIDYFRTHRRPNVTLEKMKNEWLDIASSHVELYESVLR